DTVYPPDGWPVPLRMGDGVTTYTPYRLVLGVKAAVPMLPTGAAVLPGADNDNVLGNPEPAAVRQATTLADFAHLPGVPAPRPAPLRAAAGLLRVGPPPWPAPPLGRHGPLHRGVSAARARAAHPEPGVFAGLHHPHRQRPARRALRGRHGSLAPAGQPLPAVRRAARRSRRVPGASDLQPLPHR